MSHSARPGAPAVLEISADAAIGYPWIASYIGHQPVAATTHAVAGIVAAAAAAADGDTCAAAPGLRTQP